MWICDNLSISKEGRLTFAGRDAVSLAEKYGTPLMLLDEGRIRRRCREYKKAMEESFGGGSMRYTPAKRSALKKFTE